MSESNWIEEAKKHFEENGDKTYTNGDEISKKSQEINERLKNILVEKFTNIDDMELNLQGSKWNLQGHQKLKDYIWYRASYKEFGKQYPVVFGIALGKAGLNFEIQIYNDVIGNLKISKKLGEIISEIINEKKYNLQEIKRKNPKEDYLDYGYFGLDEFDDDKFNEVMAAYKEVVVKVHEKLNLKLDDLIDTYKKFIESNSVDNPHISVASTNELVSKRKKIFENFKKFIEEPKKLNLSSWWDGSINSANMQGNFTNLVKNLEDKSKEEVENLRDDEELKKVQGEFNKIKDIVFGESWEVKDSLTFDEVENGVKDVNSMNATAKELAYYLQMNKDKIPLVNSMTQRKVELIAKIFFPLSEQKTLQEKFELLREEICKKEGKTYLEVNELKSFYLVDQFLNLIDKVKQKDVDGTQDKAYYELYKKALEFKNFLGGEVIKNDDFIELLKQGQNIIYYGAPGTGKTFGVLEDVKNTVDNVLGRYEITQFHPSYSYEDFVEGIRPKGIDKSNGSMQFGLEDGEFKKFCKKAREEEESFLELKDIDFKSAVEGFGYFFIIDEINRAELSRVFGELLFALEYRGADKGMVKTQYSSLRDEDDVFYIPENIFVIGTMNDVDRSIDSFDLALRRRFIWIRKDCNYDVITTECKYTEKEKTQNAYENIEKFRQACSHLNEQITLKKNDGLGLGKKYEIGHAYFLKISKYTNGNKISQQSMNKLFDYHIEPLLSEYLRSEYNEEDIEKHVKNLKNHFKLESK